MNTNLARDLHKINDINAKLRKGLQIKVGDRDGWEVGKGRRNGGEEGYRNFLYTRKYYVSSYHIRQQQEEEQNEA